MMIAVLLTALSASLGVSKPVAVVGPAESIDGGIVPAGLTAGVARAITALGRYTVELSDAPVRPFESGPQAAGRLLVSTTVGRVGPQRVLALELIDLSGPDVIARTSVAIDADPSASIDRAVGQLFGAAPTSETPTALSGRLMIPDIESSSAGVYPLEELTQAAAAAAAGVEGLEVVTRQEIKAVLQQGRLEYETGCLEERCLVDLGKMAQASLLARISVAPLGDRALATASLIDVDAGQVTNRATLTLQREQLADGMRVLVRRLLGQPAQVEPLPGASSDLNRAIAALSQEIAGEFRARSTSKLDRLGWLPFVDVSAATRERGTGAALCALLQDTLTKGQALKLVDADRLQALADEASLGPADRLSAADLAAAARFLGSSMVLRGSVSDIGDHLLLQLDLVSGADGEVVWNGLSALPRAAGLSALADRALVRRTTAGSVVRALVLPGWGQIYNDHTAKGVVISVGVLAGLGAMATTLVLANQKQNDKKRYDPAETAFLELGCAADVSPCRQAVEALEEDAKQLRLIGLGAAGVAAAIYLWGIIDAAVFAEDYSDATLVAVAPLFDPDVSGVQASFRF